MFKEVYLHSSNRARKKDAFKIASLVGIVELENAALA